MRKERIADFWVQRTYTMYTYDKLYAVRLFHSRRLSIVCRDLATELITFEHTALNCVIMGERYQLFNSVGRLQQRTGNRFKGKSLAEYGTCVESKNI